MSQKKSTFTSAIPKSALVKKGCPGSTGKPIDFNGLQSSRIPWGSLICSLASPNATVIQGKRMEFLQTGIGLVMQTRILWVDVVQIFLKTRKAVIVVPLSILELLPLLSLRLGSLG